MARGEPKYLPAFDGRSKANIPTGGGGSGRAAPQSSQRRSSPERTCLGCRARCPQSSLIRVSLGKPSQGNRLDEEAWLVLSPGVSMKSGSRSRTGRSAYFHNNPECIRRGCNSKQLGRALRRKVSDALTATLREQILSEQMVNRL